MDIESQFTVMCKILLIVLLCFLFECARYFKSGLQFTLIVVHCVVLFRAVYGVFS